MNQAWNRISGGDAGTYIYLESQIYLVKRRRNKALCLSYKQNLPHKIRTNSACKIKLRFFSIVIILSIQFFVLYPHSSLGQELMFSTSTVRRITWAPAAYSDTTDFQNGRDGCMGEGGGESFLPTPWTGDFRSFFRRMQNWDGYLF